MQASRVVALFTVSVILPGCSRTPTSGAAAAVPPPDGGTPQLPRLNQPALGNLDQVGTHTPISTTTAIVLPAKDVPVSGWAVDDSAHALAGGVDVVVDGSAYRAEYGLDRPDVSKARNVPAYDKAGFAFVLHGGSFPKGKHNVLIRVIGADRKSYADLTRITIEIE